MFSLRVCLKSMCLYAVVAKSIGSDIHFVFAKFDGSEFVDTFFMFLWNTGKQ